MISDVYNPIARTRLLTLLHRTNPQGLAFVNLAIRLKRFDGQAIAIYPEQKRGPLIYALSKYEFLVLHPVNTSLVAKYRQAFAPSWAKADPTDAHILVELLLKHPDKLKAWQPSSTKLRSLQSIFKTSDVLLPLNRPRWLRGNVIDHPIHAFNFIHDPI